MAEISLRIVIDPSGALRTFDEMMATMKERVGVADPGRMTIANLERGLQSLRTELNNTEIGTQRFNELRTAITRTEIELRKTGTAASSAGIAFDDVATRIGFRLQGFQNMFSVLSGFLGGFIRESNAGEAATAKLTQALQNQGAYTQELVNDLKAFAAERQQIAAIDDDATIAVMGQLTALGLQGQALRDATVAVQDLATLMDGDMNSAVKLVADAFQGNTAGLKRLKVDIDETALKERGAIVIIEALTKAVGGQAEAFGNTGAGAMKKMQLASDDLRQSFGDLLKDALAPFTSLMRGVIEWMNSGGNAAKSLTLGLAGLGIAFAFVNTSMGAWPYILTAAAAALMAIYNAVKDGQGYLVALGGVLGTVAFAFTLLQGKAILAAISMNGVAAGFTAARLAVTGFFAALGPVGWILVGLGAIAAAWGAIRNETRNAEEAAKQYREAIRQLSDFKLGLDIGNATVAIADLSLKLDALKKGMNAGQIQASPELLGLELQLAMQRERLKLLQDEQTKRAQIADAARKQAAEEADPKIQLELRELRVKAMQDGITKELALLDVRHTKEIRQIEERQKKESLSDTQVNELKTATTQAYTVERTRIIQESYAKEREEREKSASEYYDYTQHLKKLDEELAIDLARTDEEKYDLKRSFMEREIADLEALGVRTLEQEKRLADARTGLKKLNNAEAVRLERERQELEERLRDLRTGDIAEDNSREIAAIRDKYARLRELAIKHGRDISAINRAQAAEEAALRRQQAEQARRLWQQDHELAMVGINAIGAGYSTLWSEMVVGHRQAKDEGDAIWLAIKNSALNALGAILVRQIENAIVSAALRRTDVAEHAAAEGTKTTVSESNALARVATAVWEGIRKAATWAWEAATFVASEIAKTAVAVAQSAVRIATTIAEGAIKMTLWLAEQAAFIAKEIAMTVVFLAQQAIRVAAALAEVAVTIAKAVANFIVSLGPFGLFAAAGAIAAGVAVVAGIKSAFGFERGGQFEKDQRGFIEGGQTEIIAPRRTFDEIMRTEIIPMLVKTTQMVTLQYQQPALAGYDFGRLEKRLDRLDRTVSKKEWSPVFENFRDEERIVRTTLPGVERRLERRRR